MAGGPAPFKVKDYTSAIDQGFDNQKKNQPCIIDLVTLDKLYFQTIPLELAYNPESNFVVVAPPGRNNPLYQYTGGEDTLNFSLSWYSDNENNQDVLMKCKWLESLGKNDGYDNKPHPVQLIFGDLFRGAKWILTVQTKWTLFNRDVGMMPRLATTEITLRRITETNRKRSQILILDT